MGHLKLIVVAGQIGAGKSTAAKHFESAFAVRHMSFVDVIWLPILERRGLAPTRRNLQILGLELMREMGPEGLVGELLRSCPDETWCSVDDVRTPIVLDHIESRAPGSCLLFLETPFESRFPRLVDRDGVNSEQEQREAESFPTERDIESLRPRARWVVSNDGSQSGLHESLDAIAVELGIPPKS
jgi:dephospho-CoA kinase